MRGATVRLVRPAARVALVLALAGGMAGCTGGSGSSAASTTQASTTTAATTPAPVLTTTGEVFTASQKAITAATSAHVTGLVDAQGQKMRIELAGNRDATNQSVTITVNDGAISILTVDGSYYLKGDAAFWKAQGIGSASDKLAGKYVAMPASEAKSMADFSVSGFLDEVFSGKEAAAMAKSTLAATQESVDGVAAYVIKDSGTVLYIARDSLLPVKLTAPNGEGTLTFSDWNAVKPFTAPGASDIVDPKTLK